MHNPFLLHPQQLRQQWKDLRVSVSNIPTLLTQLQTVSAFWNQAPTGKPYLDYLAPQQWPDAWMLLENKMFDRNSLSLGMFYTLLLCDNKHFTPDRLQLAMIRQPSQYWEGLVCIVDNQLVIGYDRDKVCHLTELQDVRVMHMYKYDLQKRYIKEISAEPIQTQMA